MEQCRGGGGGRELDEGGEESRDYGNKSKTTQRLG